VLESFQEPKFTPGGGQMSEPIDANSRATVTQLLIGYGKGDRSALDEMLPLVYNELRRLASYYLNREREGHTLQTTALVHEAYLRLVDQEQVNWKNRSQFLGVAAQMMRRILVNHARDRAVQKRGGDAKRVSLSIVSESGDQPDIDLIALDQALNQLSELDTRKARIVELKFFGGMTTEETAEVLEISTATVEREWNHARAWLYRAITGNQ
jgi:RNA polymerase sigma-70 factor, ECF subfamily